MKCADKILMNANVVTLNPKMPRAEALAIAGERILKVGGKDEILKLADESTEIIDLEGRTVVPGFIDTHAHPTALALSSLWIDLKDVGSIEELRTRVEERVRKAPRGSWILGFGWDQEKLIERRYPSRFDLDDISRWNPVFLRRYCGHVCLLNSRALEILGISENTPPPEGGAFDRDPKTGELTGILREKAVALVLNSLPKPKIKEVKRCMEEVCERMLRAGITTIHWIMRTMDEFNALSALKNEGKLRIRVNAILPYESLDEIEELTKKIGFGDDYMRIGTVKIVLDGSLGARTAALREPYSDFDTGGMLLYEQEELDAMISKVHCKGLQLAVHAIGDRAVESALISIERALEEHPRRDHRHRIEHASVLREELIDSIPRLGVIITAQPHFVVSDTWIEERLGNKRLRWSNPYKSLLLSRVIVTGGSDAPVEPVDPLSGIWAAVDREINSEEKVTVEEALKMYTINGAYASFEEKTKGSIVEGKLADLTILSGDPTTVEKRKIKEIRVEATIVGGLTAFEK